MRYKLYAWALVLLVDFCAGQQKALGKNLSREKINHLSTQALRAMERNEYEKAIAQWGSLLTSGEITLSAREVAEIESAIGSTYIKIGEYGAAIRHLNKSIEIYAENEILTLPLAASLVDQARAYLGLGQTYFAKKRLTRAMNLLKEEAEEKNQTNYVMARAYLTLGNLNMIEGKDLEAEENYQKSLEFAQSEPEKTITFNNLSKLFWDRGQKKGISTKERLKNQEQSRLMARQAVELSHKRKSLLSADSLLQLIKVSQTNKNNPQDYYLQKAEKILTQLPSSRGKIHSLIKLSQFQENPVETLTLAGKIAEEIKDYRSGSFAWGYLGKYYEEKKQDQQALFWTNKARSTDYYLQGDDSLYRWHWQGGRIYTSVGEIEQAKQAYASGISSLQRIRENLARESKKQLDFEEEIEPVYREYLQLILENNPRAEEIKQALEIRDLLQLSELENYFGDECFEIRDEQLDLGDKTGLIHTIILNSSTYLIVQIPNQQIKSIKIDISSLQLEEIVKKWRYDLENRENDNYLFSGKAIYDLLIKPLESSLADSEVETLIFVNDGIIRNIPMSALYNGKKFLVEDYAVGFSLGLNLQTKEIELGKDGNKMLVFGLSEGTEALPPLPYVEEEINTISELVEIKEFLNAEFIVKKVKKQFSNKNFPLVHIASHAQFKGTLEQSFISTYQGKINLLDWENMLQAHQTNFPANPIKLLTLSACETAAGNKQAILGLAGIAIRSGIENSLGSLWSIDDQQTVLLMKNFYRYLLKDKLSQFQALQLAQKKMIKDPNSHPAIWSSFSLIVN